MCNEVQNDYIHLFGIKWTGVGELADYKADAYIMSCNAINIRI